MGFQNTADKIRKFAQAHPLFVILLLGTILRLPLIFLSPVHGDEGMYIYDSGLIIDGATPFSDFHTRAPVFLYSLAAFMIVGGESVISARLFSLFLFLATAFLLFKIGRELKSKRAGLFSSAVFSLSPFGAVWGIVVETEVCLVFFVSLSALFLLKGLKCCGPPGAKNSRALLLIFLSGLTLGMSVFSRRTAAVVFPAFLLYLYLMSGQRDSRNEQKKNEILNNLRDRLRYNRKIILFTCGFLLSFILFAAAIVFLRGADYFMETFLSSAGVGSAQANRIQVLKGLVVHAWYLIFPLILYLHLQTRIRLPGKLRSYLDIFSFLILSLIISIYTFLSYLFLIPILGYFLYLLGGGGESLMSAERGTGNHLVIITALILLSVFAISPVTEEAFFSYIIVIISGGVIVFLYLLRERGARNKDLSDAITHSPSYRPAEKWGIFLAFTLLFSVMAASNKIFLMNVFSILLLLSALIFTLWLKNLKDDRLPEATTPETAHGWEAESAVVLPALWLAAVGMFYLSYNMLGEVYLYELLPPASILVGLLLNSVLETHPALIAQIRGLSFSDEKTHRLPAFLIILLFFTTTVSGAVYFNEETLYTNPGRTDDFTEVPGPETVKEAGKYIREHTHPGQEILTANMAIAVEAHRNIVLNLSHPTVYSSVYRQGFAPLDTINYPTLSELMDYMNRTRTKYVVYDLFFNQYYLKFNPVFRDYIFAHYHLEKRIDNVDLYVRSNYDRIDRLSLSAERAGRGRIARSVFPDVSPGVVWEQKEKGRNEIYYGWLNETGRDYKIIKLSPEKYSKSYYAKAAMDSRGRMHVVWEESFGDYSVVDYAVVSEEKKSIKALTGRPEKGVFVKTPVIGVDHENDVHVLWTDNRDGNFALYYLRLDENGTVTMNATELVSGPGDIRDPALSIDSENNIHTVFEDGRTGSYQVNYMVLNGTAENKSSIIASGPAQVSHDYRGVEPDVWVDQLGSVHITFRAYNQDNREYIHYFYQDMGGNISERNITLPEKNVKQPGGEYYSEVGVPSIACLDGYVVVGYERKGMNYDSRIELSIFASPEINRIFYREITCSRDYYYSLSPDIAEHKGNLTVLYTSSLRGQSTIFFEQFDTTSLGIK